MRLNDTINQFHRSYSDHDIEGLLTHLAEDVTIQFPTGPQPIRGKKNIGPVWTMVFTTLIPDIRQELLSTVAHEQFAACEFIETGTLTIPAEAAGPLGLTPGGRPYSMNMASFFHFDDEGLIDEIRSYWDTGSFADQIGIDIAVIRSLQARAHSARSS
ncbi:nuclear transport factor 2 family protein [Sphaerisporangium fuscum]|uniref:nuclear transport factor 2 family protein n=1 Tax=Sphaerisporangium fuscum TaxID=2835868 RepID=UPI001BDD178D|nr:nuclear transport factor 2 family protein [Sphaerisporangium fuscum]